MTVLVLSTACEVISSNGQGQLCPLACGKWRGLSNHTRMSTIQSRTREKNAKNYVTLTWKFPWKSCSTTHLPFISSNLKILNAFLKTFPTKMKHTKCPAREKKWGKKSEKKRGGEKEKFCFLHMPELRKLIFCIWIRRPRSVRPVTGFVVSFRS